MSEAIVPFRCEIVGKGPLQAALAAEIARLDLGDHVSLVGPLPREAVAQRLREAALLALPCIIAGDGNRDGLPTVFLEAMAVGLPVVTTRVTGNPEAVVDGQTGRVVEPGAVDDLATALEQVVTDLDLRARFGTAARQRAEELFDLKKNVGLLDGLLRNDRTSMTTEESSVEQTA